MKYAAFDQEGNIIGFYAPEIHKNIPSNTIQITDEQWQECLSNQGRYKVISGQLVSQPLASTPNDAEYLQAYKDIKKAQLNKLCKQTICSGFYSFALGEQHKYESEIEDQINLLGSIQLNEDMLYRCWNTEETYQEWYFHTAEQLRQAFRDGTVMVRANLERVSLLKEQVDASTTIEEINNIQW